VRSELRSLELEEKIAKQFLVLGLGKPRSERFINFIVITLLIWIKI